MTSNSKSINNQDSCWKVFLSPIFCITGPNGRGRGCRVKKGSTFWGWGKCFSSGELSIIQPLFGLLNRSHSHELHLHTITSFHHNKLTFLWCMVHEAAKHLNCNLICQWSSWTTKMETRQRLPCPLCFTSSSIK